MIDPAFPNVPPLGEDFDDVLEVVWTVTISSPRVRVRVDRTDNGFRLTAEDYDQGLLIRFDPIDSDLLIDYVTKANEVIRATVTEAYASNLL